MPNIDEHIRKALEEGMFENLPGKGQHLRLEEDPFTIYKHHQVAFN